MKRISTQPCDFVPFLPWVLVIEILSWLPVKTLMQFKCVSKSWNLLISKDKAFEKLHLKRSQKNKHVLLTLREEEDSDTLVVAPCPVRLLEEPSSMIDDDRYYNLKAKYYIIGSCNGLVCLGLGNFFDFGFCSMDKFYVRFCNPATNLIFEKSPAFSIGKCRKFGFGYDDSRDTYKVVVLSNFRRCGKLETETMVYCMDDNSWKKISSDPGIPLSLMWGNNDGEFVSGCVNWLAQDPNHLNDPIEDSEDEEYLESIQMVIVSFDMREETFRFLPLPGTGSIVPHIGPGFGVLGNCLCLYNDHEQTHFVVWQMREYGVGESWTQLLSVSYAHLGSAEYVFNLPRICLREDGDVMMLIRGFGAIKFNIRENRVKHVQHPDSKLWLNVQSYVESLVSPR